MIGSRTSKFDLLGPVTVELSGFTCTPTPPKLRTILALLLIHHGRVVSRDQFIDELWLEEPPASASALIQTYVHKLRKLLMLDSAVNLATRQGGGYLLDVGAAELDFVTFAALSTAARRAAAAGDLPGSVESCAEGLALWSGSAMDGVVTGPALSAQATWLEEQRLQTIDTSIEVKLRLGQHEVLVSELSRLAITYPLRESFTAALVVALQRCGRRADALSAYRRLHDRMLDELGAVPSIRLRRLHADLLDDGADVAKPPTGRHVIALIRPAQLPPATALFGRDEELRKIENALAPADAATRRTSTPVVSIVGMAGAGKTALALQAAHRLRDRFPDGQLYATLRGAGGTLPEPGDVLRRFLRSGVGVGEFGTDDVEELAAMFRSWSAGRCVLVMLDDAQSAAQVAPLLPGGAGCAVVVTSRTGIPGVGATTVLELRPLDPEAARQLLVTAAGPAADRLHPAYLDRIVETCERLPLALLAAGARLLAMPDVPAHQLVAELTDGRANLLDTLAWGEFDVRGALAASYHTLDPQQRRTLAAVGAMDTAVGVTGASRTAWPIFTAAELAAATRSTLRATVSALDGLARHRLLRRVTAAADGTPSYRVGRLVACFAAELDHPGLDHPAREPSELGRSGAGRSPTDDLAGP